MIRINLEKHLRWPAPPGGYSSGVMRVARGPAPGASPPAEASIGASWVRTAVAMGIVLAAYGA